jgi:hypothetical protein
LRIESRRARSKCKIPEGLRITRLPKGVPSGRLAITSEHPTTRPQRDRPRRRDARRPAATSAASSVGSLLLSTVLPFRFVVIEADIKRFDLLDFRAFLEFLGRFLGCHGFSPSFGLPPWAVTSLYAHPGSTSRARGRCRNVLQNVGSGLARFPATRPQGGAESVE